jgi:hypothetical protein
MRPEQFKADWIRAACDAGHSLEQRPNALVDDMYAEGADPLPPARSWKGTPSAFLISF